MIIQAPNVLTTHAFTTRSGGVSGGNYASLNLGGSEDDPQNIRLNRERLLSELRLPLSSLCNLKQVHGTTVVEARPGAQEGDAIVSAQEGLTLAVSVADCYPILFHDPEAGIIGAAHAGWRGTAGKICLETVKAMATLGAKRSGIHVAIGQGISPERFEVGEEVIRHFIEQGFPSSIIRGRYIDLIEANIYVLLEAGIRAGNIWSMKRCTFEPEFFSYRRDQGKTGRMWGLISQ